MDHEYNALVREAGNLVDDWDGGDATPFYGLSDLLRDRGLPGAELAHAGADAMRTGWKKPAHPVGLRPFAKGLWVEVTPHGHKLVSTTAPRASPVYSMILELLGNGGRLGKSENGGYIKVIHKLHGEPHAIPEFDSEKDHGVTHRVPVRSVAHLTKLLSNFPAETASYVVKLYRDSGLPETHPDDNIHMRRKAAAYKASRKK